MKIRVPGAGLGSKLVDLSEVEIPDLVPLAKVLPDVFADAEKEESDGGAGREAGRRKGEREAESVLDVWHIAHSLLIALKKTEKFHEEMNNRLTEIDNGLIKMLKK